MKTHSLFISSLFLFSLISFSASAAENFIISGNPKAPPIVWEQYNKLTGIGPDLAKSILTDLGLSHDIRITGNWQQVQDKCKAGEVDMIVSAYKNDERATYMNYSVPYLPQPTVIIVKKGMEFAFGRWESLIGKRGVSNIGESYGQEFDDFIKGNLDVKFIAFERAIELLNRGEADYLIVDLFTALIYSRLLQGEDAITILDPPVTTQTFHMAIGKGSALVKHMPAINKKLSALVKDGTVEKLFYKHFEDWKKLIAKRSRFLNHDNNIRGQEHQSYVKKQDKIERERIADLLTQNRDGLPAAIE